MKNGEERFVSLPLLNREIGDDDDDDDDDDVRKARDSTVFTEC